MLGFNVFLTLFQSYCDGTCMRQVIVLPHWNAPVAGTWQEHPTQSHIRWHQADQPYFQALTFQAKRKQGSYLYHLFTTFGMSRLGIEPATFRTQSERSTSKPPGSVLSYIVCRLLWCFIMQFLLYMVSITAVTFFSILDISYTSCVLYLIYWSHLQRFTILFAFYHYNVFHSVIIN